MKPVQFSESVSLANVKDYELDRFVSVCDQAPGRRVKSEISFGEALDAVGFADSVYCYRQSTRKRFRSTVFYEPSIRPKGFSETYYILPRHTSVTCESTSERHPNKVTRRWYSASLFFDPQEFDSGIQVIGTDDVFATQDALPRKSARGTGSHDKAEVPNGRHLSTIEVDVEASPTISKSSDRNNNIMADNSYTIRIRSGGDVTVTPGDQIFYRSAVKVVGNPND